MAENPVIKEKLMNLRKADHHLRLIAHSGISTTDSDILTAVHKLLWTIYRNIENGK